MSFSGHQPYDPTAEAAAREDFTLTNDGFYPDIESTHFLGEMRITDEYRTESIRKQLRTAVLEVNARLQDYACAHWGAGQGWPTLAESPAVQIDGESSLVLWYRDAVYSLAKCYLMREYATLNRKEQAENIGKEAPARCQELVAAANLAIRRLRGENSEVRGRVV